MSSVLGTALVLLLLLALVAGLAICWRRPFLGLGFLVVGMAFHNFLLMVLLKLGAPSILVRVFQAWKELLLLLLIVLAMLALYRRWRTSGRPSLLWPDWLAVAFAVLVCAYFVVPQHWLGGQSNLAERLVAFRAAIFLPLLYLLGRAFAPRAGDRDLAGFAWLVTGSTAVVGAFGLVELFLLPTRIWVDWGENLFNSWLGFSYNGPGHLPDNFFQTLFGGSLLLRRMVSTYLSPLGIAYTGLMILPVLVLLVQWTRRRSRLHLVLAGLSLALLVLSVFFSVTRLAIACMVVELALLAVLYRDRWLISLAAASLVAAALIYFVYPKVGPVVDRNLNPANVNYRTGIISAQDPSTQEHTAFLIGDVTIAAHHPLGVGLGSAVFRYGAANKSGESAVLSFFVDMGVLGGFLYLAIYLFGLWNGYLLLRAVDLRTLAAVMPLAVAVGGFALFPVTLTSDIWGASGVTFLFWWAAGHAATMVQRRGGGTPELEVQPRGPAV